MKDLSQSSAKNNQPPSGDTIKKDKKMIVFNYPSKKEMKANVGQPLKYIETSMFGNQYLSDGYLVGANRPHITGQGREFFAEVTMKDGLIHKVK
tara:strand:+ start:1016 stop:1297 length:282 start_codon:yes stop_codon:yes gene_type:complete